MHFNKNHVLLDIRVVESLLKVFSDGAQIIKRQADFFANVLTKGFCEKRLKPKSTWRHGKESTHRYSLKNQDMTHIH